MQQSVCTLDVTLDGPNGFEQPPAAVCWQVRSKPWLLMGLLQSCWVVSVSESNMELIHPRKANKSIDYIDAWRDSVFVISM